MNYIQRLFDSAAPAARGLSAPVAPPTAASSPVVAADQRLGVFPGLVDPFGLVPALPDTGAPEGDLPAPDRRSRVPDRAPPPADPGPARQGREPARPARSDSDTRGARPAPDPTPTPARHHGNAALPPMSPLQRLVESAPLPDPRPATPRDPVQRAESPAPAPPVQPRPGAEAAPPPAPAQPATTETPAPSPLYRNPAEITPDQFKPRAAEATPAPPPDRPAPAPDVTPLPAEPPRAEAPARPAPLQPATDAGPSPFARQPDLPPAPDTRLARADTGQPVAERIIERIREVPVAPSPPPKAMTAAAQSVIGPLGQRRSGGWQPRQGGF